MPGRCPCLCAARTPPQLARRLAARCSWQRSFSSARAIPSSAPLMVGVARAARRLRLGDAGHRRRRLPRAEPADRRAGSRHGQLRRGLPHRHAGIRRRRHRAGGVARGLNGLSKETIWPIAYAVAAVLVLIGMAATLARTRAATDRRGDRARARRQCSRVFTRRRKGCLCRVPDARCGDRDPGLRGALQAVRRARRRHDRALSCCRSATPRCSTPRS